MKSQPITSITIEGGQQLQVAELPKNIQDLVDLYNDFLPKTDDARTAFAMAQAALKEVVRELTGAVQEWQKQQTAPVEETPVVAKAPARKKKK